MTAHWPVQVPVVVRERDCGLGDELDESAVLVFFREARRAYLGVLNAPDSGYRDRVVKIGFRFNRTVAVDDDIAVRIRCDGVGERAFRFQYLIRDRVTAEEVVYGTSVHQLLSEIGHAIGVPQRFRDRVGALEGRSFDPEEMVGSEIDDARIIPAGAVR